MIWVALALLLGSAAFGARSLAAPADDPAAVTVTAVTATPSPIATATPTPSPSAEAPSGPCPPLPLPAEPPAMTTEPDVVLVDDLGTPVAAPTLEPAVAVTPEPSPPCDPFPAEPAPAPEPEAPAPPLADEPVPDPAATPRPEAGPLPAAIVPETVPAPEDAQAPVVDPSLQGLAIPGEPPADPALTSMPVESAAEPAADPMLAGLRPGGVVATAALPQDPAIAGLSDTVPATSDDGPTVFRSHQKAVAVDAVTASGTVAPGGSTTYRFRLENVGRGRATFDLVARTDKGGWVSSVLVPPAYRSPTGRVQLDAGEIVEVTVTVTAPTTAVPGDEADTQLDVVELR